jgi:hypothetical protein
VSDQPAPAAVATFAWPEARERLAACHAVHALRADGRGAFVAADGSLLRFVPPAVLPEVAAADTVAPWFARAPDAPGRQAVVLVRAGSAALGVWDGEECTHHKVFKRYVVRGHGKAQPAHAKTRGKSRYGSRLRLQNAQKLLAETNERLCEWARGGGGFERIHWSCPVRQWAELFRADPAPPFAPDDPRLRRITLHVHEPDFAELLRVRRALARGRIERAAPATGR